MLASAVNAAAAESVNCFDLARYGQSTHIVGEMSQPPVADGSIGAGEYASEMLLYYPSQMSSGKYATANTEWIRVFISYDEESYYFGVSLKANRNTAHTLVLYLGMNTNGGYLNALDCVFVQMKSAKGVCEVTDGFMKYTSAQTIKPTSDIGALSFTEAGRSESGTEQTFEFSLSRSVMEALITDDPSANFGNTAYLSLKHTVYSIYGAELGYASYNEHQLSLSEEELLTNGEWKTTGFVGNLVVFGSESDLTFTSEEPAYTLPAAGTGTSDAPADTPAAGTPDTSSGGCGGELSCLSPLLLALLSFVFAGKRRGAAAKNITASPALLLCVLIILAALPLTACEHTPADTPSEQSTEQTAQTTPPASTDFVMELGESVSCVVYYPDNAEKKLISGCERLAELLCEVSGASASARPLTQNDTSSPAHAAIYVGDTGGAQSNEFMRGLLYRDYGYKLTGNGVLCVGGHTGNTVLLALNSLCDKLRGGNVLTAQVNASGQEIKLLTSAHDSIVAAEYKALTVNNTPIGSFVIVAGGSNYERELALQLKTRLADACGCLLPITRTSGNPYEIHVGDTGAALTESFYLNSPVDNAGQSFIIIRGGQCALGGSDELSLRSALSDFSTRYLLGSDSSITLTDTDLSCPQPDRAALGLNARYDTSGIRIVSNNILMYLIDNERRDAIELAYTYLDADVILLQEVNAVWHGKLDSVFESLGYTLVAAAGESNNTKNIAAKYNYTPIYYRADKLTLKASGYNHLQMAVLHPWVQDPTSKSYTWALFEENATGKSFIAVSTHFSYNSDAVAANLYRTYDANEIVGLHATLKAKYGDIPFVVMGDLNSKPGSEPLQALDAELDSAREGAAVKVNMNYRTCETNFAQPTLSADGVAGIIDHCYYSRNGIEPEYYETVISRCTWCYSDHQPHVFEFRLK